MIDVVVMAHPKRHAMAEALADQLNTRIVWDQHNDEWDTGRRAWQAINRDADYGIVIQDDAQPVPDFRIHAEQAINQAPVTACISFYTGTGRPRAPRVANAVRQADQQHAAWLHSDTLLWGVAVALPTAHIPAITALDDHRPYDQRIGRYCRTHHLPVLYTWPSLVDHNDGPGLVQHQRPPATRRAHRTGTRPDWHGPTVTIR